MDYDRVRDWALVVTAAVALLGAAAVGFKIGQRHPLKLDILPVSEKADTLYIRDTITREKPVYLTRYVDRVQLVPVTDTIRFASEDGRTGETVPRAGLYAMQTPQGGRLDMLLDAFEKAERDGFLGTDDAAVLSHAGYPVYLASGSRQNLKLTVREDLAVAEALLSV
jgi:2-C-methyl-D-erythritol 4-phosphate cytidylyltransferase